MMIPGVDSHYSERYLLPYLLCRARAKQHRCSVGRHILKSKYFDDIYCEVESQERCLLYLFDIKQHRYKNRRILFNERMDRPTASDFDLKKYFKAYLQLQNRIDKPIKELVVWSTTDCDRKNSSSGDGQFKFRNERSVSDLFEPFEFDIHRHRIESNVTIEKELIKSSHPLYDLAVTIAHLMLQKSVISTKTVPERFYILLLKDVFKDKSHFKEEFIQPSKNLCCEAKQFHDLLKLVLSEQFRRRNLKDFHQLWQIEQNPFAELVQLKVLDSRLSQSDISDATWNVDYNVSEADVQQFLSLLVFYGNVPTKKQFEDVLQRYCGNATHLIEKICEWGILLQSIHLDRLIQLMIKVKSDRLKSLDSLKYKAYSMINLEKVVLMCDSENVSKRLIIKADGNLQVSADRVAAILEKSSEKFIFLDENDLSKTKLSTLMSLFKTYHMDWLIVVIVNKDCSALEYIKDFDCRVITVVSDVDGFQNQETTSYTDTLNFDSLLDETKERISSTTVQLQGRYIQLGTLLSEQALRTIPMTVLSDWSKDCYQQIVIGESIETSELEPIISQNLQTKNDTSLDPFETDFDSLAILCGLPGMGKSTLLRRLAVNFSKTYDDHIVLLVYLKECVDWIDCSYDLKALILRLMDINSDDNIKKFIIQQMIDDRRIIFLIDGFDEICSRQEENAFYIINWLEHANLQLVLIATRPHKLEILQQHLENSTVYHFSPFTKDNQLHFLQKRLSNFSSNESRINELIKTFKSLFNDESILDVPLHVQIVASIYENDLVHHPIQQWNAAELLQRFVDKIFEFFADKFFDRFSQAHEIVLQTLKKSFEADHSELAFCLATNQTVDHDNLTELEPYGLLRMDNGAISFINEMFEEFFAAQYIVRHQAKQCYFNEYMVGHFCKAEVNRLDSFLEYHISKTDCRQELFGAIASSRNMNLKELRSLRQYKLHSDKIKQWHIFFVECCTLEQQLEYLRRCLAKAEFSTFQVIYESLPDSLVHEICFKVGSTEDNPFVVNLENASECDFVQLLKIFHHEHPNEVVRKIITNFDCNEDDFITTAIKRDYRSVIEQLFYIENNLYEENESDLLQVYLAGRWRQYLKLAAEYRRATLLEHLLGLIVNRFHPRVIKHFLISRNIPYVLMETFKGEQMDEQVVTRVLKFVEQHLSDHDLYALLHRIEGEFAKKLNELQNPIISELFQSLWNRRA